MLNTDYKEVIDIIPYKNLIYTGPIDEYFNYCYGKLPYRSIEFQFETLDQEFFQPHRHGQLPEQSIIYPNN